MGSFFTVILCYKGLPCLRFTLVQKKRFVQIWYNLKLTGVTSSRSSFHRRRLRDACNPWNLVSVACTAGSRETLECNSMRYVAHASYNEIAIDGLWKKLKEIRELLEKIKNKLIVSDRMLPYHSNESYYWLYRSCDQTKNHNHAINKVKNLGYDGWLI